MSLFEEDSVHILKELPIPGQGELPAEALSEGAQSRKSSTVVPEQVSGIPTPSTEALPPLGSIITRPLLLQKEASITRVLPRLSESTSQRLPVVIKGEMKKVSAPSPLPLPTQEKRRRRMSLSGLIILLLVTCLTLLSASPLGHEIGLTFDPWHMGGNLVEDRNPTLNDLIAQATATAIFHQQTDGYDPFYSGSQVITTGNTSLNWPVGECTYWANQHYYALTGYWVAWSGNADQWVDGARKAGWHVSQTPHIYSIIVLMPGTQGASRAYGHVAVVEGVSGNIVHTSNMNWYENGGGFNRVSTVDFTTGPGVYFVWHA